MAIHQIMQNLYFFLAILFILIGGACRSNKQPVAQPTSSLSKEENMATPGFRIPDNFINLGDVAVAKLVNAKTIGGITPKDQALADLRFPQSRYLYPLTELNINAAKPPHMSSKSRVVNPRDFDSWKAAGIDDPAVSQILMTPGDYTAWGVLSPSRSGMERSPVILRYYDPNSVLPYHPDHPVRLKEKNKEVIIEGLRFDNIQYWIVHGLSFRGKTLDKRGAMGGVMNKIFNSKNIVIDYCLIEDVIRGAFRIVNTSYSHIQNCVFRQNNPQLNGDGGAVGIQASRNNESRNVCVVNNEVINFNDGFGLPREGARNRETKDPETDMVGDCPGTVFENNDIYITELLYTKSGGITFACAENAFDLKNGTKSHIPADKIRIIGNRMWGFRQSDPSCGPSGSAGPAITLHRHASNVLIKDNIIFDAPIALSVLGQDRKFPEERMENLAFVNNLCFDINKMSDYPYSGAALLLATGIDAFNNTILNSHYAVYISNRKAVNYFQCNTFINTEIAESFSDISQNSRSDQNAWYQYPDSKRIYSPNGTRNTIGSSAKDADLDDFIFYIKRWTGPEKKMVPNAVPSASKKGPKVPTSPDCHCGEGGDGGRWWAKE